METKTTAPFDALNNTKQDDFNFLLDKKKYLPSVVTVHVRWPGQTCGALGLALIFLVLFASRQKEHKSYSNKCYILSFACAKERTKEKHPGNDVRPLPDAVIKLQYYC